MADSDDASHLQVHPRCLLFFMDETGHEEFADPAYPIFGIGGCMVMAGAVDDVLKGPWRTMKEEHFGGADVPLHASELRDPTPEQLNALSEFFQNNRFGRFAVTMAESTKLPEGNVPYEIMPNVVRNRWKELTSRVTPIPTEVALLHEASERGDALIERYFGKTVVEINGEDIPVHHGIMPKGDEGLEVADFIMHAAGGQERWKMDGKEGRRRDFEAVFNVDRLWQSFISIDVVSLNE